MGGLDNINVTFMEFLNLENGDKVIKLLNDKENGRWCKHSIENQYLTDISY